MIKLMILTLTHYSWNASVAYTRKDWKLNLFGSNLTDEEYYSSLVTSLRLWRAPGIVGSSSCNWFEHLQGILIPRF